MNWECLDHLPHYKIGTFLGHPLYLPRVASNYFGQNINSTILIWRSDKNSSPAIINIRHCVRAYLSLVTKCSYLIIPPIYSSSSPAWTETSVNYELQHELFSLYKQKQSGMSEDSLDLDFEDWCKCSIGEFISKSYPQLLTDKEKHCLNQKEANFELKTIEPTFEESEVKTVDLFTLEGV